MVTRTRFNEQLGELYDSLVEMGRVVEAAINDATKALVEQDVELAKKAIVADDIIDEMEREIERLCLKIILRQQPVAGDLRLVSAVMKIITDLERIGDHAADISEFTVYLSEKEYIRKMVIIPKMAEETMRMLNMAIDSFIKKDLELANAVIAHDDVVDALFLEAKERLIAAIKEDVGKNTEQAMDFIMIAKYFERIGDHATNIAEWVVFSLTGVHKDGKVT